jgi:hypothetical protein
MLQHPLCNTLKYKVKSSNHSIDVQTSDPGTNIHAGNDHALIVFISLQISNIWLKRSAVIG